MAEVTLYDQFDRPIRKELLDKELAAPSLTGIRSVWNYGYVTGGLTPERLAALLQQAVEGDADHYLTLAEEIEEKDLHYASVLGTRKRAVARLPIVVESASDSAEDTALAEEIRALFKIQGTKGLAEDLLDALGKGYSAVEIIWDKSQIPWKPRRYEWRDPRFFKYDLVSRRELRLKDEADMMNGIALEPYKFITHTPRLKTGIPIRGGLARLAAWTFIFKHYTVKDWVAFCEVFGMPLRLGKYRPGETEDNITILKAAVANMGSDAGAVIPEGMSIEFAKNGAAPGGDVLFERAANWFDKQLSKGILGQTMTADDGSSKAQAAVHNDVRADIRDADAEQLAETLERDLVIPYIVLNHGPQAAYPRVYFREPEQTDIPIMATALAQLIPLGLRVEISEVRDKLGFSDPAEGAECLGAPSPPPPPPATPVPPASAGKQEAALNREAAQAAVLTPEQQSIENLKANTLKEWQSAMAPMLDPVVAMIQGSASYEEAVSKLADAYGQMDETALGELLSRACFSAQVVGQLNGGGNA